MEARIATIVASMSLQQKVGQITQPEIQSITPDEVRQHYIGSVFSGGGSWPDANKHASPSEWLRLADAYWDASMSTDSSIKIPIMWGIDAIHGNSNVFGATLFPHNVGLGATRDPDLIRQIGAATARQLRVTGQDWTFAPTVAVVRDDRWGRTYEGYAEHPAIAQAYGRTIVEGLQDTEASDRSAQHRLGDDGVIATAKHFIGDGGTDQGRDQGVNTASVADMINIHGEGFFSALAAGAQAVMVSYSSWTNEALGIVEGKLHGSQLMLTDVLKEKIGFDGLVISDSNGVGQVPGCSNFRCAQAINAGIDMVMVPTDWRKFISHTIDLVERGDVPMSRIDDAVTRILRVKFRVGLFDSPKPSGRPYAGDLSQLMHRELAREAVQKSLALLKNNNNVLPLARNQRVLVVGKSADSLPNQTGGWSLTWQGTHNCNDDFPNGSTILAGIRDAIGGEKLVFSEDAESVDVTNFDVIIAVIGERPYAESGGDIGRNKTLEHCSRYPEDLAVLDNVSGKGVPVVTILISGRPLYVNKELNRSDAFIAAWLPGTDGEGVIDVLFRKANGDIDKD
ncbi:MAG TPA: glycoside hydrolase family 3 protein, partial [Burkholderiales bacterium]|nr:glycoside hydrolase family 3 protein [Burkholderiales bacterium]